MSAIITVSEYYQMAEEDRLPAGVELISGGIRQLSAVPAHVGRYISLCGLLVATVGEKAWVAPRVPLSLPQDDLSEPRPDLMLVRPQERDGYYDEALPTVADVLLVVEISDSIGDEQQKVALYARNSIPELWVLDLKDRALHVFHRPVNGQYRCTAQARPPGTIEPQSLPGTKLDVAKLFAQPLAA